MKTKTNHSALMFVVVYLACVGVLTMAGCTRGDEGKSKIEITLPPHPSINEKSANYRPQSNAVSFCYLVNITRGGVPGKEKACYPTFGVHSDFRPPLSVVTLEVEKGKERTVELFGYIPEDGQACTAIDPQTVALNRLFRLAKSEMVDMSATDVTVRLNLVFPGVQNHVGIQDAAASSCYAGLPPVTLPGDPLDVPDTLQGTRFQMRAQVNGNSQLLKAQGSHFRMSHEVIYVRQ